MSEYAKLRIYFLTKIARTKIPRDSKIPSRTYFLIRIASQNQLLSMVQNYHPELRSILLEELDKNQNELLGIGYATCKYNALQRQNYYRNRSN